MKKLILIVSFFFFTFNVKAFSCTEKYRVETASTSDISKLIGCTDNYDEAVKLMRDYPSTKTDVAVIYRDDTLINARYAVVNLAGRSGLTNLYDNANLSGTRYTYFDGDWGADAAFIDYNPSKNTIKIKLSGAVGYISSARADIIPISDLYANTITTNRVIKVRSTPEINDNNQLSTIQANTMLKFIDKVEAGSYLWYKINFNDSIAYVAGKNIETGTDYVKEETNYSFKTYYYVNSAGNLIHYYKMASSQASLSLGPAFSPLKSGVKYYSFDGNYFYTTLEELLDDYYNGTYEHALNMDNPYFNYFMYLPTHNMSGYTADDLNQIIKNKNYTKAPEPNVVYYDNGWTDASRTGVSALYGAGEDFIRVQEEYGVNALLMFGTAINESATGTSALALWKKNLFGQGAYDSCPLTCANTYETVYDSIVSHAKLTGTSYSNPTNKYFYGSFYGNKGSGFGVNYASDPYWGEKTARLAYQNDLQYGGQDFKANTLGIKLTNEAIAIKKSPSMDAENIYILKNNKYGHLVNNMSYIVTEKVLGADNEYWYKVYTDSSLDKNQNLTSGYYNFNYSYGYIKADYLYLTNKEAVISALDVSLYRGEDFDAILNVTASDPEDGDLTANIVVISEVDVTTPGEYKVTYKVTDSTRLTVSKEIIVTVLPSLEPKIEANDITILQYEQFNPLDHVKVYDSYGNLMNEVSVIKNEVDMNKPGVYEVTYEATYESFKATKTIKVTIKKNEEPTLNASSRRLKVGENFDYLSGVSAYDIEDGDITSKITYEGSVDTSKTGTYEVTYIVFDSVNQKTSKTVTITIEDINYIASAYDFYFGSLEYNNGLLSLSGYLAIKGTNNTKEDKITYELLVRNNETLVDFAYPLERLIDANLRHYSDSKYTYTATWFQGSVNLDKLPHGEYTLYVRARKDNLEALALFRNLFLKPMTQKGTSGNKGFLFRSNNYLESYPLELFVFENGLLNEKENAKMINMINSYKNLSFQDSKLTIKGISYNIGYSYAKNVQVKRELIFEHQATHERYTYEVGSFVGSDIPLNTSDGFTKERGWFEAMIDLANLPVGSYVIYVATETADIADFGELNDVFMKDLSEIKTNFAGKRISFKLNTERRFRLEMVVEAL